MQGMWVAVAERLLAESKSTFAILPLRAIRDPHGYRTALQAKGFAVESPE
jgi:hypothetical protein